MTEKGMPIKAGHHYRVVQKSDNTVLILR